jgi:hypothetical protein
MRSVICQTQLPAAMEVLTIVAASILVEEQRFPYPELATGSGYLDDVNGSPEALH